MSGKEKCSECMYTFTMQKLPRKLPCCQHSICQPCIRKIIDDKQEIINCGFCTAKVKKGDIQIFSLNTTLLFSLSQITKVEKVPSYQSYQEANQLLQNVSFANNNSTLINTTFDRCPIHRAPLDIVCISDKQRICPHCALFGNHRQHRLKSLDDFQREVAEKKRAFFQIQNDKNKAFNNDVYGIGAQLKSKIELKRAQLCKIIEDQFKRYELQLRKRKETAFHEIQVYLSDYEQDFRKNGPMAKFQQTKNKVQQWEKKCLQNLYKLDSTKRIQDRLSYYYEGPLQIVTEGYIFIEQLNIQSQQTLTKVKEQISDIKIKFSQRSQKWIENYVKIIKGSSVLTKSQLKISQEVEDDTNPFLDCTSSAIMLDKSYFLNNNSSIQAQINSIAKISKRLDFNSNNKCKNESKIKMVRSHEKERPSSLLKSFTSIKKPVAQTQSPKFLAQNSKRPSSELSFYKSLSKLTTRCKQKTQNDQESKVFEAKQPQKKYLQFTKNTLSDFFDLSACNLPSDQVVQYVHRARRIQKIRGLKICDNKLNTIGFQKMTQFLQGVSNINAANNLLNESIFDVILKYRDRLDSLKVINLTHNPINIDVKTLSKIEQVKKMNIVITL